MAETGYENLRQRHIENVRRLYEWVKFTLEEEGSSAFVSGLPTDERIERMEEGGQSIPV